MTHVLEPIELRILRAEEHRKRLDSQIQRQLDAHPLRVVVQRQSNQHTRFLLQAVQPSPGLSITLGDCLHNLRSCLDHVVWSLVRHREQLSDLQARKICFPIFSDKHLYDRHVESCTLGCPPDALAVFESVQPFANPLKFKWLGLLHALSAIDRHRDLRLMESYGETEVTVTDPLDGGLVFPVFRVRGAAGNQTAIAVFKDADALRPVPQKMDVTASGSGCISLEEPRELQSVPVGEVVDQIVATIRRDILPRLAPILTQHVRP